MNGAKSNFFGGNSSMYHQLKHINEAGGGLKFKVDIPYPRLLEKLGEPNIEDDPYKVDASWGVQHEDGRKLFIWNDKNGPAYTGEGTIEQITHWSFDGDETLLNELFGECKARLHSFG